MYISGIPILVQRKFKKRQYLNWTWLDYGSQQSFTSVTKLREIPLQSEQPCLPTIFIYIAWWDNSGGYAGTSSHSYFSCAALRPHSGVICDRCIPQMNLIGRIPCDHCDDHTSKQRLQCCNPPSLFSHSNQLWQERECVAQCWALYYMLKIKKKKQ